MRIGQPQQSALVVALLAMILSASLHAHARLTVATPADGTEGAAPAEIVLEFSESVHVTAITLASAAGTETALGDIPAGPAESFAIPVPVTLAPATYHVNWRAVSADTHIISGDFSFTVRPETPRAAPAAGEAPDGGHAPAQH